MKDSQQIIDNNINQNGKDINNNTTGKQVKNIFGSILNDNKNTSKNTILNTASNKKPNNSLNIYFQEMI